MKMRKLLLLLLALCLLPASGLAKAPEPGGMMAYGRYPQGTGGENEAIQWRVLQVKDGAALLLSDRVLDVRPVQAEGQYRGFEGSELAAWLDGHFLHAAFNEQERAGLLMREGRRVGLPSADDLKNKAYGFGQEKNREAKGTEWANAQGLERYANGSGSYWIFNRSESNKSAHRRVMRGGSFGYSGAASRNVGLRPMILVSLTGAAPMERAAAEPASAFQVQQASPAPQAAPPSAAEPSPAAVPSGTWARTGDLMTQGFPKLTPEGFLPEGEKEFIFIDEAAGIWRYASQGLRIVIHKVETEIDKTRQRYLAAHIFLREGETPFRMYAEDADHLLEVRDKYKAEPYRIARKHGLVFSMDGDYFLYRVARKKDEGSGYSIGLVVRQGKVLIDDPPSPKRSTYPPLDMMALFADGDFRVYKANEHTAAELVSMGALDVLSFGPWLVRDGELNDSYINYGTSLQPRAGMGMYQKGHYLALIAEGRIRESKGLSTKQFGQLFLDLGCPTAFNLDGGWTSAMVFMGKQLNQLDANGVRNNARPQNEVIGIGSTQAFPEDSKR